MIKSLLRQAAIEMNRVAVAEGQHTLYSNGSPVLAPDSSETAAMQVLVTAQNLFTFVGSPTEASTTSIYKSWIFGSPPDLSDSWAIKLPSGALKAAEFIRYETKGADFYIVYFKHTN